MPDVWKDAAMGLQGALIAALGFVGKRLFNRLDAKADRAEVVAICKRLEKNHDALVERFDKSLESASQSRARMHEKLDAAIKAQNEFNLKVAERMGRGQ